MSDVLREDEGRREETRTLDERLRSLPRPLLLAFGFAALCLVWLLDRSVPGQVSLSVFYLLPVGFASWWMGGRWGLFMCVAAALAWLEADLRVGHVYRHWVTPYWNAAVRLMFFLIVTALSRAVVRFRETRDLERELRRTAEEASRTKSQLVSLVSHEFLNILTPMKLALSMLQDAESDPRARQSALEMIARAMTYLQGSVANFLNLGRLEAGRFVPAYRKTLLRDLLRAQLKMLEPVVGRRGLQLTLDFPAEPVPVRTDPDALNLVMSNLIGNACKYTQDGGSVTIRILPEPAARSVLLEVRDTGIGIPPDALAALFSGFQRTEEAKKLAKGYGVGLKVSQELLATMGSKLEVESVKGKGSRFFFRLPFWEEGPLRSARP